MSRRAREVLPQNESPGLLGLVRAFAWCLALPVAALVVGGLLNGIIGEWLGNPVILLGLLALPLGLPAAYRGALRSGVSSDSEGLTEWYDYGLRRRTPWSRVTRVDMEPSRATVVTDRHAVSLAPPLADWLKLAHTAEQRSSGGFPIPPADPVRSLPPREVANWLQVPLEGAIDVRSPYFNLVTLALLGGVVALWWVAGLLSLCLLAGLPHGRRRVDRIRARPEGIEVHSAAGWTTYAWAGVTRLSRRGLLWQVTGTDGDFAIPPLLPERERLLHAVRQAVVARAEGWSLPAVPLQVPDTALSRLDGASAAVPADRGLSQTVSRPADGN